MDPRLLDRGPWGLPPLLPVDDEAEAEAKRKLGILESPSLKSAPSPAGFGIEPLFEPSAPSRPSASLNLPLSALDVFNAQDLASRRYDLAGALPGLNAAPPQLPPWQETSDPRVALAQRDARLRAMGALPASEVQDVPAEYGLYDTLKQLPGATLEKLRQGLAEGAGNTASAIRGIDVRAPEGMASLDPLPLIADALDTYAAQPESRVQRPAIESEGVYGQLARPVTDVASTLGKFLPATMVGGPAGPVAQLAVESFGGNLERQKASGYEGEYGKLDSTVLAATKAAADAATMQIAAVPAIKKFVMGDREVLPTLARIVRGAWKDAGLAGSQVLAMTTAQAALDRLAGNFDPNAVGPDTAQMLREGKVGEAWRTFATDPGVIAPVKEALTWAMFSGLHSGSRGVQDNLQYQAEKGTTPGAVERFNRGKAQADADREAARQAATAPQEAPLAEPTPPAKVDLSGVNLPHEPIERIEELWHEAYAANDLNAMRVLMREHNLRRNYPNWADRPDAEQVLASAPKAPVSVKPEAAAEAPTAEPTPPEPVPAAEAAPPEATGLPPRARPIGDRKPSSGWAPTANADLPDAGITSDGREIHNFLPRGLPQGDSWIEGPAPRKIKANAYDNQMADSVTQGAQEALAAGSQPVEITHRIPKDGKTPEILVASNGAQVDSRVYGYATRQHPDAHLEASPDRPNQLLLVSADGKLRGAIGTLRAPGERPTVSAAAPEPPPVAPPVAAKAPEPTAEVPPEAPKRPAQERYDEARQRYDDNKVEYDEVTKALANPELGKALRPKYERIQSMAVNELVAARKAAKEALAEGAQADPEFEARSEYRRKTAEEERPQAPLPPVETGALEHFQGKAKEPAPERPPSSDPRVAKLDKEIATKTQQIDRANAAGNVKLGTRLQGKRSDLIAERNRIAGEKIPSTAASVGREPSARGPRPAGESAATLRSRRDFWLKREAEASAAGKAGDANSQAELAYARRQREEYDRQLESAQAAEERARAGQSQDTRTGSLFDMEPEKPKAPTRMEVKASPTEQESLFSAGRGETKRGPKAEERKPEEPKPEAELPDEPGGPGYDEPTKGGAWAITETPEIVELAEKLNKGKLPKLVNRIQRVLGRKTQGRMRFKEGEPNSAVIEALRSLLKQAKDGTVDARELNKVLTHEIGHLSDFFNEGTLKRGNVLGHIASLSEYLKHTLRNVAVAGDTDPSLNAKELGKRAEKETPRQPQEAWTAWRGRVRARFKELKAELLKTDYTHKALVEKELLTVSMRHSPAPADADARYMGYRRLPKELYADAVSAMIYDPHLFETLAPHTMALLENYMKANKPEMWKAFEDMRALRAAGPEVMIEHRSQRAMQATEEGLVARIKEIWRGRPELDAEGKRLAGRRVQFGREFMDTVAPYYAYLREVQRNVSRRSELEKGSRKGKLTPEEQTELGELRKRGGRLDLVKRAIRDLDAARHSNTEKAAFMLEVHQAVIKPAQEAGLNINHLGNFAKLRDAAQNPEIAGELGIMGKHAQEVYDHDYRRLTKRQQEALDTALDNWRKLREARVLSVLEASQALSEASMKKLWSNVYYARRQLVEEMEKHDPTSALKLREGDFGRLGNSFMETMLTDMGLMQWAHRQESARHTVEFLDSDFKKFLQDAPLRKVGGRRVPSLPNDPNMAVLSYRHLGEEIHKWVPKYLAELHHRNPRELSRLYRTYSKVMAPFRALMVTHNPGFALWNFRRDRIETIKKAMVNENPVSAWAKSYYYSWKAAQELAKDVGLGNLISEGLDPSKSLYSTSELEMLRGRGMTLPGKHSYERADEINPENLPDALLVRLGYSEKLFDRHIGEPVRRAKVFGETLSDILSTPSRYTERIGKIAGYKYLKARQEYLRPRMERLAARMAADPELKLTRRERREQSEWEQINTTEKLMARVRNRVGTPDVLRHGIDEIHALTNSIFLFSNVSKEGMRGHLESLRENPASYALKTAVYTILPKMLQIAAAKGAIAYFRGETAEQEKERKLWWASVDRSDLANYIVVPNPVAPWRIMSDGKTREARYMRFPYDFTGVAVAKVVEAANLAGVEGFRTEDLARIANETMPWALSSLNPAIESLYWWTAYSLGQNPVSLFSGTPIYTDREWDAGPKASKLFWETWSNLGGSLVFNPTQFDRAMSTTDFESWLRATGPLGALLNRIEKTSNRGIAQGESAAWDRAQRKQLRAEGERRDYQTEVLSHNENANMRDAYDAAKARGIYVGPEGENQWNSWQGSWRRVQDALSGDRLKYQRERAKQNAHSREEFRRLGERTGVDYLGSPP